MIELTTPHNGRAVFVAPAAIATVSEAGTSSQWHGIRAVVKLFDGRVIETSATAHEIAKMIESHS